MDKERNVTFHQASVGPIFSRRQMLKSVSSGFGFLAFAGLAAAQAKEASNSLSPKGGHHPARAKRIIFLCMRGGPSHVDLFDYKPELNARTGEPTTIGRDRGGTLGPLPSAEPRMTKTTVCRPRSAAHAPGDG